MIDWTRGPNKYSNFDLMSKYKSNNNIDLIQKYRSGKNDYDIDFNTIGGVVTFLIILSLIFFIAIKNDKLNFLINNNKKIESQIKTRQQLIVEDYMNENKEAFKQEELRKKEIKKYNKIIEIIEIFTLIQLAILFLAIPKVRFLIFLICVFLIFATMTSKYSFGDILYYYVNS